MNSVINENYEIFQFLIESGAEVDSDALIEASCRGRSDMVLLIIKKEVDVNERTDDGVTSLLCAVSFNRDKVVKLLLDEGADPFIEDKNGWSSYDLGIHKNYEYFIGMVDEMYDVHTIQPRSR